MEGMEVKIKIPVLKSFDTTNPNFSNEVKSFDERIIFISFLVDLPYKNSMTSEDIMVRIQSEIDTTIQKMIKDAIIEWGALYSSTGNMESVPFNDAGVNNFSNMQGNQSSAWFEEEHYFPYLKWTNKDGIDYVEFNELELSQEEYQYDFQRYTDLVNSMIKTIEFEKAGFIEGEESKDFALEHSIDKVLDSIYRKIEFINSRPNTICGNVDFSIFRMGEMAKNIIFNVHKKIFDMKTKTTENETKPKTIGEMVDGGISVVENRIKQLSKLKGIFKK
jgi:hypothetical protein